VSQLRLSHYERAFRNILSRGLAARRAFDKVVARLVSQQVRSFVKQPRDSDELFAGSESVDSFNWEQYVSKLKSSLPTLMSAATSAMPNKRRHPM